MKEVTLEPIDKGWAANRAEEIGQEVGLPPGLYASLVTQESGGKNRTSPKGAVGPAQLMPDTAKEVGVNPHIPDENLRGGAKYLKQQLDKYGDTEKALAAYNAGPGAVDKHGGVPPYPETQKYVKNVMNGQTQGKEVTLEPIEVQLEPVESPKTSPKPVPERLAVGAVQDVANIPKGAYDTAKWYAGTGNYTKEGMAEKQDTARKMAQGVVDFTKKAIDQPGQTLKDVGNAIIDHPVNALMVAMGLTKGGGALATKAGMPGVGAALETASSLPGKAAKYPFVRAAEAIAQAKAPEWLIQSATKLPLSDKFLRQLPREEIGKSQRAGKAMLESEIAPNEYGLLKAKAS